MTEIFLRGKESNKLNIREKFSLTGKSILVLFILLIFICVGIRIWAEQKISKIPYPSFISASGQGVAVAWGHTIYLLDHEGHITGKETIPENVELTQLKLVDNETYIADVETQGIYKLKDGGLTALIDASKLIHFLFKFSFNADKSKIYIADGSNHRIHIFHADGRLIKSIGREGKNPGELKFPNSIVLTQDGNFLIVNTNAFRLDIFSPEGEFVKTFADVTAIKNNNIKNGVIRERVFNGEAGTYEWPTILTLCGEKAVFLLAKDGLQKSKLVVYDDQGQFAGELIPSRPLKKAVDVASWENKVVVTDEETRKIHLFNVDNMSYIGEFSKELVKLGSEETKKEKEYSLISRLSLVILLLLAAPVTILFLRQRRQEANKIDAIDIRSLIPPEAIWAVVEDKRKMIHAIIIIALIPVGVMIAEFLTGQIIPPLVTAIILILLMFSIPFAMKFMVESGYLIIARRKFIEKILKAISSKLKEALKPDETIAGCTVLQKSMFGENTLFVLTSRQIILFDVTGGIGLAQFSLKNLSHYGYRNIKDVSVENVQKPSRFMGKTLTPGRYTLNISIDEGTGSKELTYFLVQKQILEKIKAFLEENRFKGEFIDSRFEHKKKFKPIHPGWRGKTIPPRVMAPMLSAIFPGLGQFYNRQIFKGRVFSAVFLFLILILIYPIRTMIEKSAEYGFKDIWTVISMIIVLLTFYGYNIADAYHNSTENKL